MSFPSDKQEIQSKNGMPMQEMLDIMTKWDRDTALTVYDIEFENNQPAFFKKVGFTNWEQRDSDEFVEFMASVSLTHTVMFVTPFGQVFITRSTNGQTNIDFCMIEAMLNAYYRDENAWP
jgi:hypothetical protein